MVQKKYPYIPNQRVFDEVLKLICDSGKVPTEEEIKDEKKITSIYREANSTLSVLQRIGIINGSNITELGKKLRLKGQIKKDTYNELLESQPGFSELINIMRKHPGDFPRDEIENHLLMNDIGSQSTRSKIISFFKHLLKSADIEKLLLNQQEKTDEKIILIDNKLISENNYARDQITHISQAEYEKPFNIEDRNKPIKIKEKDGNNKDIKGNHKDWIMQFLNDNLKIEINENWDQEKIKLVFDRLEKILKI